MEIIPVNLKGEAINQATGDYPLNNKNNGQDNTPVHSSRPHTIVYDPVTLREIGFRCKHDKWLKILPFGAIRKIHELKINNKRICTNKGSKMQEHCNTPNTNNLINIKKTRNTHCNIIIGTCNIQSLELKELQVNELLKGYCIDLVILTETWLKYTDNQWINSTMLN